MKGPAWLRLSPPLLLTVALLAWPVSGSATVTGPATVTALRAPHPAGLVARATTAVTATCDPYASSLPPPSGPPQVTPRSFMATIRHRGYLIAGVDQNAYPFGFFNPLDGKDEGFDIDMIKAVADAIFGNPNQVRYVAISDAQRKLFLEQEKVDIVAHTMTINCSRLKYVYFSSVYFDAHQRVLVLKTSRAGSMADLRGQKVCATVSSDSYAAIAKWGAIPVLVPFWTDCLVKLQQGDVAAISTDDSILNGLNKQDPWTKLVGPWLEDEPYGLAIALQHPEFVRFVNAVLEQMRTDGQWNKSYAHWIGPPVPDWPRVQYRTER